MTHKCLRNSLAALTVAIISTTLAQVGSFPGDFSEDGHIDLTDFAMFAACLGGPDVSEAACADGDFDWDDDVDLSDARRFQVQFGRQSCQELPFDINALPVNGPDSIVITDLNNDLIQDLVVGQRYPGDLSISFGLGHGDFAPFETYASGAQNFLYIAADDFDNDGNIDLAVAGLPSLFRVTVLFGDGLGGLASSPEFLTWCNFASRTRSISSGDFDGNGLRDILLATDNGLACFQNNGDRTFLEPVCLAYPTPAFAEVVDFNNDGLSDAAVSVSGGVGIFLSNGDGSFNEGGTYSLGDSFHISDAGDLNADGVLDLVVANPLSNSVSVLLGFGDGTFEYLYDYVLDHQPWQPLILDIGPDDSTDVLVSTKGGIIAFEGCGNGTLLEDHAFGEGFGSSNYPYAPNVAIGELNGDQHQDLAIASFAHDVVGIVSGRGDGRFEVPLDFSPPFSTGMDFVHGDFDNDGDEDLAVKNLLPQIAVFVNSGSGSLTHVASYETLTHARTRLAVADLDHDGDLEMLAVSRYYSVLNVLQGKERAFFEEAVMYEIGGFVTSLIATDYNHDTHIDAILTNNQGLVLMSGNGDGTLGEPVNVGIIGGAKDVCPADFNHDGMIDLAVLNDYYGTLEILIGNGDGTFTVSASEQTAGGGSVVLGDVDGDDIEDLVVTSSQHIAIHFGSDYGSIEPASFLPVWNSGTSAAIADVNGDSHSDIVCVQPGNAPGATILFGMGGRQLAPPVTTHFFDGDQDRFAVQAVDMNQDGWPDLIVLNNSPFPTTFTIAPNFCGP